MKTATLRPFPALTKQLAALGLRLRAARLRRGLGTALFAERMNVSRDTLNRLEKGDPSIAMGTYLRALRVLGLEQDLDLLASDDALGRKLQDLQLPLARKVRGRRTAKPDGPTDGGGDDDTTSGTDGGTGSGADHGTDRRTGSKTGSAEDEHGQTQE